MNCVARRTSKTCIANKAGADLHMALISWILIMLHYGGVGGGVDLEKAGSCTCRLFRSRKRWRLNFFQIEREAKHCKSGGYENRKECTESVCLKPVSFRSVLLPVVFSGPCCGQCHCVCGVLLVLNWAHCWPVESEEGGGTDCWTPCWQVCPAEAVFHSSFCSHAGKDRWSMSGWVCDGTWEGNAGL